jgi:hypothetical protein
MPLDSSHPALRRSRCHLVCAARHPVSLGGRARHRDVTGQLPRDESDAIRHVGFAYALGPCVGSPAGGPEPVDDRHTDVRRELAVASAAHGSSAEGRTNQRHYRLRTCEQRFVSDREAPSGGMLAVVINVGLGSQYVGDFLFRTRRNVLVDFELRDAHFIRSGNVVVRRVIMGS